MVAATDPATSAHAIAELGRRARRAEQEREQAEQELHQLRQELQHERHMRVSRFIRGVLIEERRQLAAFKTCSAQYRAIEL